MPVKELIDEALLPQYSQKNFDIRFRLLGLINLLDQI